MPFCRSVVFLPICDRQWLTSFGTSGHRWRGQRIEPRIVDCADRLDAYWDQVADVAFNPQPPPRLLELDLMQGCLDIAGGVIDQATESVASGSSRNSSRPNSGRIA